MSTFAPEYKRDKNGLILFPDDRRLRPQVIKYRVYHPAHNNLYMLESLVEYLSKPNDTVMDIMAGAGSMIWAARNERKVILVELGPYFSEMLYKNTVEYLIDPEITSKYIVVGNTNCNQYMKELTPNSVQVIIFSPPYADQLKVGSGLAVYDKENTKDSAGIEHFTYIHRENLGNMKQFPFNMSMRNIYKQCLKVIKPGGYLTIIIKDQIKDAQRVGYGILHWQMAVQEGFKTFEWHKRYAIGNVFGHFNLSKGYRQITDEHIIILKKPKVS